MNQTGRHEGKRSVARRKTYTISQRRDLWNRSYVTNSDAADDLQSIERATMPTHAANFEDFIDDRVRSRLPIERRNSQAGMYTFPLSSLLSNSHRAYARNVSPIRKRKTSSARRGIARATCDYASARGARARAITSDAPALSSARVYTFTAACV